jgi:hypothetical protein
MKTGFRHLASKIPRNYVCIAPILKAGSTRIPKWCRAAWLFWYVFINRAKVPSTRRVTGYTCKPGTADSISPFRGRNTHSRVSDVLIEYPIPVRLPQSIHSWMNDRSNVCFVRWYLRLRLCLLLCSSKRFTSFPRFVTDVILDREVYQVFQLIYLVLNFIR